MKSDIVVWISRGQYVLSKPLVFGSEDSGSNGFRVIYRAQGEKGSSRFIGGKGGQHWNHEQGGIYSTVLNPGHSPETIYENGRRAVKARWPSLNPPKGIPLSRSPYLLSQGEAGSHFTLQAALEDLPPLSDADARDLQILIWSGAGIAWFTDLSRVAALDRAQAKIQLNQATRYEISKNARYFLQGARSFLSGPGQFHFESATRTLHYWPISEPIERQDIVIPALKSLLIVRGASPALPVHDLVFDGLDFEASDFVHEYRFGWINEGDSGEGHAAPSFDRQIEMRQNRIGLVTLENTLRVQLDFCHIQQSGFSGIYALFSNTNDLFYGNLIEHAGISGIVIQGRYPGEGDVAKGNLISNNWIRQVGELIGNASGIDLSSASDNEVSYNRIEGSPRYAVIWHSDTGIPPAWAYARNNRFKHLKIQDAAQDSEDTASIYAFGLSTDGKATPNYVENIQVSMPTTDPSVGAWPPNAIFLDNETDAQTLLNVEVIGTGKSAPFRTNAQGHLLQNVSWEQDFRSECIDTVRIGLKPDFPREYLN